MENSFSVSENPPGVLGRSVEVLRVVAERGPCSVKEVSSAARMPLSSTYRLLGALVETGLLRRAPDGLVSLGGTVFQLANLASRGDTLALRAQPLLRRLSRSVGETAFLAVRNGDRFVFLAKAEIDQELRTSFDLGVHLPIPTGALGRIFVAFDGGVADDLLPDGEADAVRAAGYASSDGLAEPDVQAIAAPVFDYLGNLVCAISVAGPARRFSFDPQTVAATVDSAAELSRSLGHEGRPALALERSA